MQILKNAGSFDILTPGKELGGQLLRIERAGRTCYQSEKKPITKKTAKRFIRMILGLGHESVIEHSNMTVRFNNCSRGFTHELVRHRLCAYSQESTRYVDYTRNGEEPDLGRFELRCVVPPHQDESQLVTLEDGRQMSMAQMLADCEQFYRALRKAGWPAEDARQILPNAIVAQIVVSANFREWRHIFKMRTAKKAHWEIRKVMGDLLVTVQRIVPGIFDDFVKAGVDKHGLCYFEQRPWEEITV